MTEIAEALSGSLFRAEHVFRFVKLAWNCSIFSAGASTLHVPVQAKRAMHH
jgi:hypothetical protein